jgi:chaperonin GroES
MDNPSGITPLDLRIVVKPDPVEEVTKGGIILADTTKDRAKYAGTQATFLAAGENAFGEWGVTARKPKPGDRVLFAQYSGAEHKGADGERYVVMNDKDLLAVIGGDR